jgi:phosphomannomutase/phosphoglucomutase
MLDETDGVKIFKDSTWALIRPSGTEPIIRIIVDSDTKGNASDFFNEIKTHISPVLGK